jgi:hypothetical protein
LLVGVKVAIVPVASRVTIPATDARAGPVSVKVAVLIVEGFIGSLKVALMVPLRHVSVATGFVETTVGGVVTGTADELVVKVQ